MGIDMYLGWKGITKEDKQARYTGFRTDKGNCGYLREAYQGSPYATQILAPECWTDRQTNSDDDSKPEGVQIAAKTLRERLPDVLLAAEERERKVYSGGDEEVRVVQQSFTDFVELAERKEVETGEPCWVYSSY